MSAWVHRYAALFEFLRMSAKRGSERRVQHGFLRPPHTLLDPEERLGQLSNQTPAGTSQPAEMVIRIT